LEIDPPGRMEIVWNLEINPPWRMEFKIVTIHYSQTKHFLLNTFMSFHAYIVIIVITFMFISLYFDLIGPVFTFIIGILVMGLFGVLSPAEILHGFGNEQLLVILMLLIIGEIIRETNFFEHLFGKMFSQKKSYKGFIGRIYLLVASFSAFLNNTPLVAVMMPYVNNYAKKNSIPKSKLLIPLSYAAILGGCVTLIGTSTHLISNGMIEDQQVFPEFTHIGIFDFTYIGLPMFVIGFIYLLLMGDKLLPDRKDIVADFEQNSREYIIRTKISAKSNFAGKSIAEAGLRNLPGLFLMEVQRENEQIAPVSPSFVLDPKDELVFVGDTNTIAEMINGDNGLIIEEAGFYSKAAKVRMTEVVVSSNSALLGKTVKEANFRSKFDAAVLSIFRNGERLSGKLGLIQIKAGDVLLILAGKDFDKLKIDGHHFYTLNTIRELRQLKPIESITIFGGLMAAIALSGFGLISLFMALAILLFLLTLLKISSAKDLPGRIDYNLAVIIALSLALGTALIKTGLAERFANSIINFLHPFGIVGILSGLFISTTLIGSFISNKAAVAIMIPIGLLISKSMGIDPLPVTVLISQAAAASFLTPIGYQTNIMVYGSGAYKYRDFIKIGLPLTVLYGIVSVLVVYYWML